jgi:4-amino-4-deoxy-L-arabinose transferase-like glycosyltransferase
VAVLWQGRNYGLFPQPRAGMDQLNFLNHAEKLIHGILPDFSYKLSSAYTIFLSLLTVITGGKLIIMRILQVALCALIPVVIFKLARQLRCSFMSAQIAALIYCFYGPAILISISFLRASLLALCFISFSYFLLKAFYKQKWYYYVYAGLLAGITVLGRENFIPVIIAPAIMLCFPVVRQRINYKLAILYFISITALLLPLIIYNYLRFNSPEIIPGNFAHIFNFYYTKDATASVQNPTLAIGIIERIPSQIKMFAASYELHNSLSFYAHRDIINLLTMLFIPFNLVLASAILALSPNIKKLLNKLSRSRLRHSSKGLFIDLSPLFIAGMATGYFLTIIYFTMFYRFRIPVFPMLCVLCAVTIDNLRRNRQILNYLLSAIFIIGFWMLTYTAPNKLRTGSERRSVVMLFIANGNYKRAEQSIDQLLIDKVPLNNIEKQLLRALYDAGYKDEANRLYRKYIITGVISTVRH